MMSDEKQETLEDIVRELRSDARHQRNWACDNPEYADRLDRLADRIEAAAKRDADIIYDAPYPPDMTLAQIIEEWRLRPISIQTETEENDRLDCIEAAAKRSEADRDNWKRQALEENAALDAVRDKPRRNCDRFKTFGEAAAAFRDESMLSGVQFAIWLFWPIKESEVAE